MNDISTLVRKAREGDKEAFSIIYERHYQAMYHYALHLCQYNHADAQEVVQDAFLSAFERLDQLQKLEYFPLWLKKIVHSKCIRLFYNNKEITLDSFEGNLNGFEEQRIEFVPHKYIENEMEAQILHTMVRELTEKQQQIITYFYFEQRSINEIAQLLNISKGTVKSRVFEARRALKKRVDAFEAREERKINFHFRPVLPSILTFCAYQLSKLKVFQSDAFLKSTTLIATTSCAVMTISAVNSTYQIFIEEEQNITSNHIPIQVQEQAKVEIEMIEFPPLQYEGKVITTPRAAYYTLIKIAPDKESMDALTSEKREALQPLLQAIQSSETQYKDTLKNNGWF